MGRTAAHPVERVPGQNPHEAQPTPRASPADRRDPAEAETSQPDPRTALETLYQVLRSGAGGLTSREATRRLTVYGPNVLVRRGGRRWVRDMVEQLTHPLALLLMVAAALAAVNHSLTLAAAVLVVVVLNAGFAFVQEQQAERAVEALTAFLPRHARVVRDGRTVEVEATDLVPGDLVVVSEGERVCADARLVDGEVEVDLSALTGESVPVTRAADLTGPVSALLDAQDVLFSGTTCTAGQARALVTATGMHTELGRIAALSQRVEKDTSPLERQVKRVAWLIAAVAVGAAVAFLPLGMLAGLSLAAAVSFAIGLLVANVPEGLLPTITLALAIGVRNLARHGAVVKRLSAVETLGSTTVICTDKTGTLTENRMEVQRVWTLAADTGVETDTSTGDVPTAGQEATTTGAEHFDDDAVRRLAAVAADCTTADLHGAEDGGPVGDPTETALLELAQRLGVGVSPQERDARRQRLLAFDARRKLMSVVAADGGSLEVRTKGAPEVVLARATTIALPGGDGARALEEQDRAAVLAAEAAYARRGLRVLAVAIRRLDPAGHPRIDDLSRDRVESDLCLLGLVAMLDPPREGVAAAVEQAHRAGIRVHIVTGDYGPTTAEIARRVGIGVRGAHIVTGAELDAMREDDLDRLLMGDHEIIFARTSPEGKLRVTDALRSLGQVVAVTGDGVNDAPALRRAHIGVAMGRSGTDVAREASTMVLTDDHFATIVAAVEAGRRVYQNVRRFILYIFTHAVPEVVPFLAFALAGGAIPLPLTVMQILAVDLGTDTLPALALSRERAEPGLMDRPPRPRSEGIITRALLFRAWAFLGLISGALVLGAFFLVLHTIGWHPGASVAEGSPLHHGYRQATTVAWLGIVFCQIGTAFAARTEHVSLRAVGVFTNRSLLGGLAVALGFAAVLVYVPFLHGLFNTEALTPAQVAIVLPFPLIVWGADELRRWLIRRRAAR